MSEHITDASEAAFEARVIAKMAELEAEAREAAFDRLVEEEAKLRLSEKKAAAEAKQAAVRKTAKAEQDVQRLKENIETLKQEIKQIEDGKKLLQEQMKPYEKGRVYDHLNTSSVYNRLEAQLRTLVTNAKMKSDMMMQYDEKLRKAEVAAGIRAYEYNYPSQEALTAHIQQLRHHTRMDAVIMNCSCGMPAGLWKPGMAYPPRCCMPSELCGQPGYNGKMQIY